jgi:hypothetical protein
MARASLVKPERFDLIQAVVITSPQAPHSSVLYGIADPNAALELLLDGAKVADGQADANGDFQLALPPHDADFQPHEVLGEPPALSSVSGGQVAQPPIPRLPFLGGASRQITITNGDEDLTLEDVLFGDVWVCSGQSNMYGAGMGCGRW